MFPKEMLVVAFVGVVVFYYISKFVTERYMRKKEENASAQADGKSHHSADECAETGCGMRMVCAGKEETVIVYFEDEELDRFKNRAADAYTDAEVADFREVLETLRGDEVADWLNSLCTREISLPLPLRKEAIALVNKNKK